MSRVNISDLKLKQDQESIFLIKYISLQEAKDGKNYLNIIFTDATGDLEARVWNDAVEIFEAFNKGDYVLVKGKLNMYQGRKQFIVGAIEKVDGSKVDQDDFIEKAQNSPDTMMNELFSLIENLNDIYIKTLLKSILEDGEINRRVKLWQAGKSIHHAYQSGLLEHMLSCAKLGDHLSDFYKVNKSYVVAGCILHDLCKIYELTDGASVEYTEEGKLVGHLVKSVEIIDRFAARIKGFPYQMKLHLKHIMVSHHGFYEFGSPKLPQTSEAMLVHQIDMMDSKMASFDTVKKRDQLPGHWSGFVKHLDRLVFKADLPTYTDFLEEPQRDHKKKKSNKKDSELKQSMGSLLKDIKIKE